MSTPVKKAALEIAKKVIIPPASRAVTAAEAHKIAPRPTGNTETTMPFNGWFSNFLKDRIGDKYYEKLRRVVLYKPDDPHSLEQQPTPNREIAITEDGKIKAKFRSPSPGSQAIVRQPDEDPGTTSEDPYDVSYYSRDTKRRYQDPAFPNENLEKIKLELMPQNDPVVKEAMEKFNKGATSSPGNKGKFATGATDYDPKGLRAAMSANHEALEESLDKNMPDHLPLPVWWDKQEATAAWYLERDLPVPLGCTGFGTIPREGRIARW